MAYRINTKGKLLFLIVSAFSLILLMVVTTLIWTFISPRLHDIDKMLANIVLNALRVFYILIIISIVLLFGECYTRLSSKHFHNIVRFSIIILFPINVFVSKLFGIKKDKIRESFVHVNNSFLKIHQMKFKPQELLILLPHCLQNFDCPNRISNNINICQNCGKCIIHAFKSLKQNFNINVAIATGGTLARKIIVLSKPKCIVAVACQKDLVDGLLEVFPIPVYGILNDCPEGPCFNTNVDIGKITDFINYVLI